MMLHHRIAGIMMTSAKPAQSECHEWLRKGSCSYGTKCKYKHTPTPERVCRQWRRKGSCSYGSRCKFEHIGDIVLSPSPGRGGPKITSPCPLCGKKVINPAKHNIDNCRSGCSTCGKPHNGLSAKACAAMRADMRATGKGALVDAMITIINDAMATASARR